METLIQIVNQHFLFIMALIFFIYMESKNYIKDKTEEKVWWEKHKNYPQVICTKSFYTENGYLIKKGTKFVIDEITETKVYLKNDNFNLKVSTAVFKENLYENNGSENYGK